MARKLETWEYRELRAMCRQYHAKKARGSHQDTLDVSMIDQAMMAIDDGRWSRALASNLCDGIAYDFIDQALLPTSNRNAFFSAKARFFQELKRIRYTRKK